MFFFLNEYRKIFLPKEINNLYFFRDRSFSSHMCVFKNVEVRQWLNQKARIYRDSDEGGNARKMLGATAPTIVCKRRPHEIYSRHIKKHGGAKGCIPAASKDTDARDPWYAAREPDPRYNVTSSPCSLRRSPPRKLFQSQGWLRERYGRFSPHSKNNPFPSASCIY